MPSHEGRWLILATPALFVWATLAETRSAPLLASFALAWLLVTLAAIDFAILRLPDVLTLPLVLLGLLLCTVLPDRPLTDHVVAAVGGYAAFALLAVAWRRWRGKEGLGLGDAKLLAAAGAWLGWRLLPITTLVAASLALAWVLMRSVVAGKSSEGRLVAFGPPLCAATWIVWLAQSWLDQWVAI